MKRRIAACTLLIIVVMILSCTTAKEDAGTGTAEDEAGRAGSAQEDEGGENMVLGLRSPEFGHEGRIPDKYTCKGNDINPPLEIENIPEGTESLALILDDPDAPTGTFVHWTLWDMEPAERISEDSVPSGAVQGTNDFGKAAYGGPCPPSGEHRYFFRLYALDTKLDLEEGASREELEDAMEGHIIEKAVLMGLYSK
ncbi:MAG: YbhB/YbcL family Raf kinase inhibitor-like protein [Candidatus Woesearchaeota archaeon]